MSVFGVLLMTTSSYGASMPHGTFQGKGCKVSVDTPGYHLVADAGANAVIVHTRYGGLEFVVTPEIIKQVESISQAKGFEIVPSRVFGVTLSVDIENNKIVAYEYNGYVNRRDSEKTKVKCLLNK